MIQRRALILYATMTKNTEKVATWFKETLEAYNWEVTFLKMLAPKQMAQYQEQCYFDDYDLVALGSPIVGGMPLQNVIKNMSMGGGGNLEKEVQTKLDANQTGDNAAAAAAPARPGVIWRRNQAPYAGVLNRGDKRPLGIVFSTYGGGFYGSSECSAVLEMLKLYLMTNNVDVIGKFCCGGKETGPAGFPVGVKPPKFFIPGPKGKDAEPADVPDAIQYTMADGTVKPGSYFFHYDCDSKPGPREEAKAKAFICDIVEDYFMWYDGVVPPPLSEILSIS
jgi:hypothetical protein